MPGNKKPISLSELIYWVKQELLSDEARKKDPVPLLVIDEVTVEVNFVVDGEVGAGFSALQVVEVGSKVKDQRVQKATIKMTPILDREQLLDELATLYPDLLKKVGKRSGALFKAQGAKVKVAPKLK